MTRPCRFLVPARLACLATFKRRDRRSNDTILRMGSSLDGKRENPHNLPKIAWELAEGDPLMTRFPRLIRADDRGFANGRGKDLA